jgi:hypothetical protein
MREVVAYVQAECADAVADDTWWDASEVFVAEGGGDVVSEAEAVMEGGMLAGGVNWWQEDCSGCGGGSDGKGAWSGGGSSAGDSDWDSGGGSGSGTD